MKKNRFAFPFFLCIILIIIYLNNKEISEAFKNVLTKDPTIVIPNNNIYKKNKNYLFVQNSTDFKPYNYQDLLNIFYTVLNSGWDSFTFYCPKEYLDCIEDVKKISLDDEILTHINNYVHPYNSFSSIKTLYEKSGEVDIFITKLYSKEKIKKINKVVDDFINENLSNETNDREKIKKIHDFIINNSTYDIEKNETNNSFYDSTTAYGALLEHYAICGGYSDAMAIFLNKIGIDNYKIASDTHIWNVVKLEDKWLHLDLTWDDPVSKNSREYLLYNYFLIADDELQKNGNKEHIFDYTIYQEIKN